MAKKKKYVTKTRVIRIPDSQFKQIEQVIKKEGDFYNPTEYVRHCIREQLKKDRRP